jgi:hypothetical protein
MKTDIRQLYLAEQTLFRAFCYLHPRMEDAGSVSVPMNAEALAGCVLHACMAKLMGEIRKLRTGAGMGFVV